MWRGVLVLTAALLTALSITQLGRLTIAANLEAQVKGLRAYQDYVEFKRLFGGAGTLVAFYDPGVIDAAAVAELNDAVARLLACPHVLHVVSLLDFVPEPGANRSCSSRSAGAGAAPAGEGPPAGAAFDPAPATRNAVSHALAAGYRHVDTAALYANEKEVGRTLKT